MAIQAQMYSGFVCGAPQDLLLTDNAACALNNLNFITQHQQEQHSMHRVQPFLPKNIDHQSMSLSQNISAQIENQRMEIDFFITLQNDKLRIALQEQRKQQTASLMKTFELQIQSLFKQKEEEMKRAASRNMELRMFLERVEFEKQTWQRVARENEAAVASLNGTIERLRESAANASAAEDAESWCMEREDEEEEEEETRKMICRRCHCRNSCVIMLPCRHLCSCVGCDALLHSCPVCKMVKESSVEVLV